MHWQSDRAVVAIGWTSGDITVYNENEHVLFEVSSLHRAPLVFLVWNMSGTRLISGDKVSILVLTTCYGIIHNVACIWTICMV